MKYVLLSQLYWVVWFGFYQAGYVWSGIIAGIIVSLGLMMVAWRLEFKRWFFR